jgi:hypothetical protein
MSFSAELNYDIVDLFASRIFSLNAVAYVVVMFTNRLSDEINHGVV